MKKKLINAIILVIVTIICWQVYTLFNDRDKVNVKVIVAPTDASIKINNKIYRQKSIKLIPNQTHQVTIMRDGFEDAHFTLITTNNPQFPIDNVIYGSLHPITRQAEEMKQEHIEDYQAVEGLVGFDNDKQNESRIKQFPIIQHLPIAEQDYNIGYYQQDDEMIISIYSDNVNFVHAINHLKLFEEDITNYKIEFYNQTTKLKIDNLFEEYIKHE